jgi:CRISPR-associated endonuclease Csn1
MRALTELRKVVNHIIKRFGKPSQINVELARDLKKNKRERKTLTEKIKKNESAREKAKKKILEEAGIPENQISRADIEKYLLAEECNWECPYTGRRISMGNLFGPNPQFDVEHIIPFHRSLDNSFFNKTLCYHEENRLVKQGKTPFEAYEHNPVKWEEILNRVKQFKGEAAQEKLRRFTMKNLESFEDFTTRQLNDTRYASKLARRYLAVLYGVKEKEAQKYIKANKGQVTAHIRNALDLNRILGDGGDKTREDHRHHAIDAIAIALSTPSIIKQLSDAASRAKRVGGWKGAEVTPPWESFYADVVQSINNIVVSHRISRKVSGPLHEETIYSPPKVSKDDKTYVHVRKRLDALSSSEINEIVDPVVQKIVLDKFNELGGGDPKKVFSDPQNHPFLTAKDGRKIPIHKVRIRKSISPFKIGNGPNERHVVHKSNHHLEIIEVTDKKGRKKWEGKIVSMYEAYLRKQRGEPIVQRDHGEGKKFLFSLANRDTIEIDDEGGGRELFIVRSLWEDIVSARISFTSIKSANPLPELKKEKALKSARMEPLRKLNCRKVIVTPLGEVRWAND